DEQQTAPMLRSRAPRLGGAVVRLCGRLFLLFPADLGLQHAFLSFQLMSRPAALSTRTELQRVRCAEEICAIRFCPTLVEKMDVLDCGRTRTQFPNFRMKDRT